MFHTVKPIFTYYTLFWTITRLLLELKQNRLADKKNTGIKNNENMLVTRLHSTYSTMLTHRLK